MLGRRGVGSSDRAVLARSACGVFVLKVDPIQSGAAVASRRALVRASLSMSHRRNALREALLVFAALCFATRMGGTLSPVPGRSCHSGSSRRRSPAFSPYSSLPA